MEISRREFVLSAFTLAFISVYPKLSYACDVSSALDNMNPKTKALLGMVTAGLVIAFFPESVPVAIIVGAMAYSITKFSESEKVGNILCSSLN